MTKSTNHTNQSLQLLAASSHISSQQPLASFKILSHTFSTVTPISRLTQLRILMAAFPSLFCSSIIQATLNNLPGFVARVEILSVYWSLLMHSSQCPEGLVLLLLVYFKQVNSRGSNIPILFMHIYLSVRFWCRASTSLLYRMSLLFSLGVIFRLLSSVQKAQEHGSSYSITKQLATYFLHTLSFVLLILSFDATETSVQPSPISSNSAALQDFSFSSWQLLPYSGMLSCSSPRLVNPQDLVCVSDQVLVGQDQVLGYLLYSTG